MGSLLFDFQGLKKKNRINDFAHDLFILSGYVQIGQNKRQLKLAVKINKDQQRICIVSSNKLNTTITVQRPVLDLSTDPGAKY